MFKIINYNSEDVINFHLQILDDIHSYDTRNSNKYSLPLFRRANSHKCFCFTGRSRWNTLSDSVHSVKSIYSFKVHLRHLLLEQDWRA